MNLFKINIDDFTKLAIQTTECLSEICTNLADRIFDLNHEGTLNLKTGYYTPSNGLDYAIKLPVNVLNTLKNGGNYFLQVHKNHAYFISQKNKINYINSSNIDEAFCDFLEENRDTIKQALLDSKNESAEVKALIALLDKSKTKLYKINDFIKPFDNENGLLERFYNITDELKTDCYSKINAFLEGMELYLILVENNIHTNLDNFALASTEECISVLKKEYKENHDLHEFFCDYVDWRGIFEAKIYEYLRLDINLPSIGVMGSYFHYKDSY